MAAGGRPPTNRSEALIDSTADRAGVRSSRRRDIVVIISIVALFAAVFGVLASNANAKEKFLSEFAQAYPQAAGSALDSCLLCHTNPSSPGEGNLNGYGRDWEDGDLGDKEYLAPALVNRDSDGDGVTNGNEIAQLSFPGDPSSSSPVTTTTTVPGTAPDGQAIYASRCSSCHGPDGGNLKGTTLARTTFISIALNGRGSMPAQSGLSSAQVGAVWDYVTGAVAPTTTTTAPGATTTTTRPASGASVWSSNCSSCHGANGGSVVPTALSRSQLITVITNGRGGMPAFRQLGAAQVAKVADYLLSLSATTTTAGSTTTSETETGTTAADHFMQNCSGCHGLHGEGGAARALVGIQASRSQIISVIASGGEGMPGFASRFTADEIGSLADHVLALTAETAAGDVVAAAEVADGDPDTETAIEYVVVPVPGPEAPPEGFPVLAVSIAFVLGVGIGAGAVLWTRLGRNRIKFDGASTT